METLALQPAPNQPDMALNATPPTPRLNCTSPRRSTMQKWYLPMDEGEYLEDVEFYRPGGFHPVLPGDFLGDNKRFDVWNKLGQGTFGIVWLCYDAKKHKFCAIKVLRSDASSQDQVSKELKISNMLHDVSAAEAWKSHVATPTEHFWQKGPNGTHLCLVMPVLGPELSHVHCYNWHDTALLKSVCFQLVEGMAFLHKHNLCHGDFRSANVLFKTNLNDLTADEMNTYMPNPKAYEIVKLDGDRANPHAPKYAILPMHFELEDRYIARDIAIIDFGAAFDTSNPPSFASIPAYNAAPENQPEINAPPALGTDLWALGIAIFQTVRRDSPFECFGVGFSWNLAEEALGPIPEPYRSRLIQHEGIQFQGDLPTISSPIRFQSLDDNQADRPKGNGTKDFLYDITACKMENLHPDWNDTTKRIEPRIPRGWANPEEMDRENKDRHQDDISEILPQRTASITRQLEPAAVPGAVDLLKQLLRWHPEDRVPAEQLLDHEWFEGRNNKMKGPDTQPKQKISLEKSDSGYASLFEHEHALENVKCAKVSSPGEQATGDLVDLLGSVSLEEAETGPDAESSSKVAQEEVLFEVESRLVKDRLDDDGLHEVNITMDQEDDEEPHAGEMRRWGFAPELFAGGVLIWVGVLWRPVAGLCAMGMSVWDKVWQVARRVSRL